MRTLFIIGIILGTATYGGPCSHMHPGPAKQICEERSGSTRTTREQEKIAQQIKNQRHRAAYRAGLANSGGTRQSSRIINPSKIINTRLGNRRVIYRHTGQPQGRRGGADHTRSKFRHFWKNHLEDIGY